MKLAFVDYRINDEEEENLSKLQCSIIKCPPSPQLYEAICGHPDILLHLISKNKIIVHKDMDISFIEFLNSINLEVIFTENSLGFKYPSNISLNAINLENHFIHKMKHTDSNLMNELGNKKLVNVNQGYSKCSTAIISSSALITNDKSIYTALKNEPIDILLLPYGDIILPGLNYGFIGGTCGLTENNLVFFGSLTKYKYGDLILDFLEKHKVQPIFLSNKALTDRGSIFFLDL